MHVLLQLAGIPPTTLTFSPFSNNFFVITEPIFPVAPRTVYIDSCSSTVCLCTEAFGYFVYRYPYSIGTFTPVVLAKAMASG